MPLSRSSGVTSTTFRAKSGQPSERMTALTTAIGILSCGRCMGLFLLLGKTFFEAGELTLGFHHGVEGAAQPSHPACQHRPFFVQIGAPLLDTALALSLGGWRWRLGTNQAAAGRAHV